MGVQLEMGCTRPPIPLSSKQEIWLRMWFSLVNLERGIQKPQKCERAQRAFFNLASFQTLMKLILTVLYHCILRYNAISEGCPSLPPLVTSSSKIASSEKSWCQTHLPEFP